MKAYLRGFLDELPNQTIFNYIEVILDHNDPDNEEVQWVKDFQIKYPGRIVHNIVSPVEPIGTSMNRCIKLASAPLVTIWNVDDLRTPNSLELQATFLENNAKYGVVHGPYKIVRAFGSKDGKFIEPSNNPLEHTRSMLMGPFFMFRKSLCEKAGYFDEQLKSGADFDLAIRLAYNSKVGYIDEPLGYYLNEGKGASTRPGSLQPLETAVICMRYGIFDKLDYDLVPNIPFYSLPHIHSFGKLHNVQNFVPNYSNLIKQHIQTLKNPGVRFFILKKIFFWKKLFSILRYIKRTTQSQLTNVKK
jgi:glycosyltransferase involved in cell wall biosynthesis